MVHVIDQCFFEFRHNYWQWQHVNQCFYALTTLCCTDPQNMSKTISSLPLRLITRDSPHCNEFCCAPHCFISLINHDSRHWETISRACETHLPFVSRPECFSEHENEATFKGSPAHKAFSYVFPRTAGRFVNRFPPFFFFSVHHRFKCKASSKISVLQNAWHCRCLRTPEA